MDLHNMELNYIVKIINVYNIVLPVNINKIMEIYVLIVQMDAKHVLEMYWINVIHVKVLLLMRQLHMFIINKLVQLSAI